MQYCTKRDTYWDPPPAGTEDIATNVHCKKGYKSDVTMYYCSVCKRCYYHHAPGHNTCQDNQGGAYGTGGHAADAVTAVRDGEYSDDDFIPFIG